MGLLPGRAGTPMCSKQRKGSSFPRGNQTSCRQDLPGQAVPEVGEGCRALKCGAQLCDGFNAGGQAAAKKERVARKSGELHLEGS